MKQPNYRARQIAVIILVALLAAWVAGGGLKSIFVQSSAEQQQAKVEKAKLEREAQPIYEEERAEEFREGWQHAKEDAQIEAEIEKGIAH